LQTRNVIFFDWTVQQVVGILSGYQVTPRDAKEAVMLCGPAAAAFVRQGGGGHTDD
jgi:hypothetical protein